MTDDADKVDALSEIMHRSNVYNSRRDEPPALATGECWFCAEPVESGRRWCDAGCRDDWQAEND